MALGGLFKCPYCGRNLTPIVERITETRGSHGKAYTPWSLEDDERLEEMCREGKPITEIARTLNRQVSAIAKRIEKHHLLYEPKKPKPPEELVRNKNYVTGEVTSPEPAPESPATPADER